MRQNTDDRDDEEQERLRGERLAAESERQRELDREQNEPAVRAWAGPGDTGTPPDLWPDGGDDAEDADDEDEWNPEPASLRDGETTDLSGHAQANLETINRAEEDGYLDSDEADEARQNIRENDDDEEGG
jgi:hypothetical protein